MFEVKSITSDREFAELREKWNSLLYISDADSVFLTWEWAFSWWEAYHNANDRLLVMTVTAHKKIVAIAPLFLSKRRIFGLFGIKEIKFLGAKDVHGEYLDFIIDPHWDKREVLCAIFQYLESHNNQWDLLRLTDMSEKSSTIGYMADIAKDVRCRFTHEFTNICPFLILPETWKSFNLTLKKSINKNFKYQKRRLTERLAAKFESYDRKHIDRDIESFWSLHEKRWTSKGLPGVFTDQRKRKFYKNTATRLSENNLLRLWYLKIDNKPIAALLGFQYRNKFYYLQSGFDPEWYKYSVGQILLGLVIKNAISEGSVEFDFLRGAESYKYDWGAINKRTVRLEYSHRSIKMGMFHVMSYIKNSSWKPK